MEEFSKEKKKELAKNREDLSGKRTNSFKPKSELAQHMMKTLRRRKGRKNIV